jgi:hypothetical protein
MSYSALQRIGMERIRVGLLYSQNTSQWIGKNHGKNQSEYEVYSFNDGVYEVTSLLIH